MSSTESGFARLRADHRRIRAVYGIGRVSALAHPSFVCAALYRVSHALHRRRVRLLSRLIRHFNNIVTGADITAAADLGGGLLIVNPAGCAISGRAGRNLTLMPCAGLGSELGRRDDIGAGPGQPFLGDDVIIEPHAGVLGPVRIGDRVRIGPHCPVLRDVPDDMVVQGPEGRVIRQGERPA